MKTKKYFIAAIAVLTLTGFTSCKKDKETPVVVINSPANHSDHFWGDHIDATATFTDDRELASYHVHIGDSDGNHAESWDYEDTGNITGKSYNWEGHMNVPDSVPDMLWLYFEVTDAKGKKTEENIMLHFSE